MARCEILIVISISDKFVHYNPQPLSSLVPKLGYIPHAEHLANQLLQVIILLSTRITRYILSSYFMPGWGIVKTMSRGAVDSSMHYWPRAMAH